MSLQLITPPLEEPVSIDALKSHFRVTTTVEDSLIAGLGLAARQAIEARYGLCVLAQSWRLSLDQVPDCAVTLPFSPILSVDDVHIIRQGSQETLSPDLYDVQGGLVGRFRINGPIVPDRTFGSIAIDFTAGWANPVEVPEEIKLAIKVLAAHFFENREGPVADRFYTSPESLNALLAPYKQVRL